MKKRFGIDQKPVPFWNRDFSPARQENLRLETTEKLPILNTQWGWTTSDPVSLVSRQLLKIPDQMP